MKNVMDRLITRIKEMNNPTVIGIDPKYDMVPNCIKKKYDETLEGMAKACTEFNKALIDATYDIIPAVKLQLAYFEKLGIVGMQSFKETCEYAKEKGMIVMADAKRGDIGSTCAAYSAPYIGKVEAEGGKQAVYDTDFITLNPYMGTDSIRPFVEDCKEYDKGAFVIVKTSNKSSGELQDLKLENGKTVYEEVAMLVEKWGEELRGEYGYSSISAVVGATYPKQLQELRKLAPHTFFLIPGYGAQGGKAEDIALGFDENGIGGIINATRSLMGAYQSERWNKEYTEEQFAEATRAEAIRMREELNAAILKKGERE